MTGPNLKWGDPCGTFELEIVPGGGMFTHRTTTKEGGLLIVHFFMPTKAIAEMQGMLNMLTHDIKVEVPNGQIRLN